MARRRVLKTRAKCSGITTDLGLTSNRQQMVGRQVTLEKSPDSQVNNIGWRYRRPTQRASRFGHYVQRYMTRTMETLRLVGFIIMALGAWYHAPGVIGIGLILILSAWLNGIASRQSSK
jgi:hypothetical protein